MFLELFKKILPWKELGWKEYGEVFYRFTILKTPWLNFYLHYLVCPMRPQECHNHPWDFLAIILYGGYWEYFRGKVVWHGPCSVLHRPAESSHSVWTNGVNWSIVITTCKSRVWGFHPCESREDHWLLESK